MSRHRRVTTRQPPSATLTRGAGLRPCQRDPPTSGCRQHLFTVVEIRYDVRNVWAAFELPHPDAALLLAPNPRSLAIRHDRHPVEDCPHSTSAVRPPHRTKGDAFHTSNEEGGVAVVVSKL
jgi:hypothetical protein